MIRQCCALMMRRSATCQDTHFEGQQQDIDWPDFCPVDHHVTGPDLGII